MKIISNYSITLWDNEIYSLNDKSSENSVFQSHSMKMLFNLRLSRKLRNILMKIFTQNTRFVAKSFSSIQ